MYRPDGDQGGQDRQHRTGMVSQTPRGATTTGKPAPDQDDICARPCADTEAYAMTNLGIVTSRGLGPHQQAQAPTIQCLTHLPPRQATGSEATPLSNSACTRGGHTSKAKTAPPLRA